MLKQRIITAAVTIPLIIFLIWLGTPWFSFLIAAVVLAGTFEFYHMSAGLDRRCPLTYLGLLWALAVVLSPHYGNSATLAVVMTAAIVVSLLCLLCFRPREGSFRKWAWMAAGVLYIGWMCSYWIDLRMLADGMSWVYLAMFTTFAYDTGAFFVGRAWGKHHLASAISPGKTWEGVLGGLLSAILAVMAISSILSLFSLPILAYWQSIVLACLVSLFAQLGDLVESLVKRNMAVKESGRLLPGHGGVLDRFDSVILVGVVVYYYAAWVIG